MINIDEIKVKFKFTDGASETLAIVTIEDNVVSLRGFRLMESKFENRRGDYLRIQPPTYGKKYHLAVYFYNKDFWYKLEDKIFESYQKEKESPNSSLTEEDKDWIDKKMEEE